LNIVAKLIDLYPEESMNVIRQSYDNELISPGMIEFKDFKKALSLGKEKCLEKLADELNQSRMDDIHARMTWWACFNEGATGLSSLCFPELLSLSRLRNQNLLMPFVDEKRL
jgi:hypothetical protein